MRDVRLPLRQGPHPPERSLGHGTRLLTWVAYQSGDLSSILNAKHWSTGVCLCSLQVQGSATVVSLGYYTISLDFSLCRLPRSALPTALRAQNLASFRYDVLHSTDRSKPQPPNQGRIISS